MCLEDGNNFIPPKFLLGVQGHYIPKTFIWASVLVFCELSKLVFLQMTL